VLNNTPESMLNCEWWNIKQAASHLGISVAFLRKAVRLRQVPFARVGTKTLRFRRSDLDRWLEANGCDGEVRTRSKEGRLVLEQSSSKPLTELE
jgi:excisionase family DNA binding protein